MSRFYLYAIESLRGSVCVKSQSSKTLVKNVENIQLYTFSLCTHTLLERLYENLTQARWHLQGHLPCLRLRAVNVMFLYMFFLRSVNVFCLY